MTAVVMLKNLRHFYMQTVLIFIPLLVAGIDLLKNEEDPYIVVDFSDCGLEKA